MEGVSLEGIIMVRTAEVEQQQIVEQSITAITKAKMSGAATSGGIVAVITSWLVENEALIRVCFTIAGGTLAMVASAFTIYYMAQANKMKAAEHKARMRKERKNK